MSRFEPLAGSHRVSVAFYGAFTAKVLVVRMHRFPGWALPLEA